MKNRTRIPTATDATSGKSFAPFHGDGAGLLCCSLDSAETLRWELFFAASHRRSISKNGKDRSFSPLPLPNPHDEEDDSSAEELGPADDSDGIAPGFVDALQLLPRRR
jgi:hypothetical protein